MRKKTDLKLTKTNALTDSVIAISSKSYVHRLIISATLCGRSVTVSTNIMSADMEATVRAVNSLGAKVEVLQVPGGGYDITVKSPLTTGMVKKCVVDCGESGSTARFILPLAPIFADTAVVTGSGRLPERPMGPLCEVLNAAGVNVVPDHLPITVQGRPKAGEYSIAGNVSSQFISGLLFMLPLLDGSSTLTIEGKLESAGYVDMTADVMTKFGFDITRRENAFLINGAESSGCVIPERIEAEGDWSNAAYIMAIAALGSGTVFDSITIDGLNPDSIQGDRAIIPILRDFGISVSEDRDGKAGNAVYTLSGNPSRPVDVDCSQIPDLVPALAVVAAYTKGDSVFRNVERLRMKECDRIEAVSEMLSKVGAKVDITSTNGSENMTVHGKGMNAPADHTVIINSFNDHRIAMAAAALAVAESMPVIIEDAMAVNKSYPGFFDHIEKLGISSKQET